MIFRRKKPTDRPAGTPVLRGRNSVENEDNPLARRFHSDDEPDTIDLGEPPELIGEPGTAELAAGKSGSGKQEIVRLDPGTGKLYALPGSDQITVFLEDQPVLSPTELRPGDRIRIGTFELLLSTVTTGT